MTFEDAAELVHELSNKLAIMVELKGDLVMAPEGTTQAKKLQELIDTEATATQALIDDLSEYGLHILQDKLLE